MIDDAPERLAVGLMSGTSMDGVDAAALITDGRGAVRPVAATVEPYDDAFRVRLREAVKAHGAEARLIAELTERHAEAVKLLITEAGIAREDVAVVGFHGQTLHHDPAHGVTVQIGDGALLARRLGVPVVSDFRTADVAAGGHGAPFAPLYHGARAAALARPVAVLNLGGVGNVSWIGAGYDPADAAGTGGDILAFDTGPGNALIDDWIMRHTGAAHDFGGTLAMRGRIDEAVLAQLMDNAYFEATPPKSLDRNAFDPAPLDGLEVEHGAATLVAFTAASVARSVGWFPAPPARWLVAGGGRHNPAIMAALRSRLDAPVEPVEAVGWDGDAVEAEAFAYLAVRALDGLPLSLPTTTGVPVPMPGGRVDRP